MSYCKRISLIPKDEGKLPERERIFSAYYQKPFAKKMICFQDSLKAMSMKWLERLQKMYKFLLLLLVYFLITTGLSQDLELWGVHTLVFSNIRTELKNMNGGVPPLSNHPYSLF